MKKEWQVWMELVPPDMAAWIRRHDLNATRRLSDLRSIEETHHELKWTLRWRWHKPPYYQRNKLAPHLVGGGDHRLSVFWGPLWASLTSKCSDSYCRFCNNWDRTGDSWQFDEQYHRERDEEEALSSTAEHRSYKPEGDGSSPSGPTTIEVKT